MKKILPFLIFTGLLFMACDTADDKDDSIPIDINGTWTLSSIQGTPASVVSASGSIVVTGGDSFTQTMTVSGNTGTGSGTVALVSGTTYALTDSSTTTNYTISSNGRKLSGNDNFLGELVFEK